MGGATVTTGPDGSARVQIADLKTVESALRVQTADAGGLRVSGLRVTKLPAPGVGRRKLLAALVVRRPVALHFTDSPASRSRRTGSPASASREPDPSWR